MFNNKLKQSFFFLVERRRNNGEPEIYILTDDSPSRDASNAPSFPAISDYNGTEQDTDGHNTLETNINVSELLLSQP